MRITLMSVAIALQVTVGVPELVCQGSKDAEERPHLRMETPYGKAVFLEASSLQQRDAAVKSKAREDRFRPHSSIVHLRGNVVVKTDCSLPLRGAAAAPVCLVLRADEAEYHEDTGQIEASGTVRVKFEQNSQ